MIAIRQVIRAVLVYWVIVTLFFMGCIQLFGPLIMIVVVPTYVFGWVYLLTCSGGIIPHVTPKDTSTIVTFNTL